MGGNAIKNTETRRYGSNEYFDLCKDVLCKLNSFSCNNSKIKVIPAYRSKESFGDMDVLISMQHEISHADLKKAFSCNEIVKNTDVTSFDYKQFQIDLIYVPEEQFDYSYSYFSFNDLGNLVSKCLRPFGLKHGHRGLTLPLREGDQQYAEILITLDHSAALEFVGLDSKQFQSGFDTLEDIFDFVSKSPYYSPEHYKLENISSIGRVRDKKRSTYSAFLQYGQRYSGPVFAGFKNKVDQLHLIFQAFPDALNRYEQVQKEHAAALYVKNKFNGNLVAQITGLTDRELGLFMRFLRQKFYFQQAFLTTASEETIFNNIKSELQNFRLR